MGPQPVFSVPWRAPVLSAWIAVHAWIETQTHLRVRTHSAQVGTPLSLYLAYCFAPSERPWSPVYARLGAWKTRRFAMFRQLAPRGSERDPPTGSMPRKAGPSRPPNRRHACFVYLDSVRRAARSRSAGLLAFFLRFRLPRGVVAGELAPPWALFIVCLLYTSPSPRDQRGSRMPSSA